MYSIKLNDGTIIDNLELNGNNFIAETEIADSVFENNLEAVTITDSEGIETNYTNMKLMSNIVREGKSWIVLGEKSESEIKEEQMENKTITLSNQLESIETENANLLFKNAMQDVNINSLQSENAELMFKVAMLEIGGI